MKNARLQAKAAACKRAQSTAELNINNVRALINGYGNMWYDGSVTQYHVPKNSNSSPLYCAALWIGGTDVNDQLRLAALRFGQRGDDYWPGPLKINGTASIDLPVCNAYDKHWIITKSEVLALKSHFNYLSDTTVVQISSPDNDITDVIENWPATGEGDDLSSFLAPFYDANNDNKYNPRDGDYPYYDFDNVLCPRTIKASLKAGQNYTSMPTMETDAGIVGVKEGNRIVSGGILSDQVLKGDQTIWWVFNDMGNTHTESGGQSIGLEIRAQAFAFATNDEINNMTFYSYEIINRSTYELRETYFSQWVDPDLGNAKDDYVGCDVRRGLGYCYNGTKTDLPGAGSYSGIAPAVGIDFFQGPYMDPDGKDNPKINIPYIQNSDNAQLKQLLERYKLADGTYDTISITDNADLFYTIDYNSWYFVPGDEVGNCAINGVNFGNNIIDDERFGMRRFVYYNNSSTGINSEPSKATDYYNYLRGYWKDNTHMKYGKMALTGTLDCDFMFPGDSDPWHWGTKGVVPDEDAETWTEYNMADNPPNDRRFMQSAGPFTLKPGAVNYITVGIPFAQASSGDQWNSVELLRQIDDICQALFENCFKVLDGPDAPTLTCQELSNEIILYLTYENESSNNYNEKYAEEDPSIIRSYSVTDDITKVTTTHEYSKQERSYLFEGYQIYQLKDASASIADINDVTKARLVAQCDIENYYDAIEDIKRRKSDSTKVNGTWVYTYAYDTIYKTNPTLPIGTLVNFTTNTATGLLTGNVMVEGANKGIQHAFRITKDAFASGTNTGLVNNREYYYVAIAYAQNRFKEYSQTEAAYLDGQKEPYLAGRKNERDGGGITAITAIPHHPIAENGGMVAQSEYGMSPNIVRLEGYGNGGSVLRLTDASIKELMGGKGGAAKAPGVFVSSVASDGLTDASYMQDPCIIANPQYQENYGPINVTVIDPLKVKKGDYNILFWNKAYNASGRLYNRAVDGINGKTRWCIVRADGGKIPMPEGGEIVYKDTVWSDFTISRYNEQLFLELGLSVALVNSDPTASTPTYSTDNSYRFYGGFAQSGGLLGSKMTFTDENYQWLSGVPDNDSYAQYNWIRSGAQFSAGAVSSFTSLTTEVSLSESYLDEDYYKQYQHQNDQSQTSALDKDQMFEDVVGGLWSPYALVSTMPYHPGFNFSYYMPDPDTVAAWSDSLNSNNYNANRVKRSLMDNFHNDAINYSDLSQLPSVRIVFTADTSKWTRCPVVEMCDDHTQAEGYARKFSARRHKSVDKHGDTLTRAATAADLADPSSPAYISEMGMGWFPGYAINTVTGERLNMMFGEDSRYVQHNGRDMLWNPVSTMMEGTQNYIMGGRHFIYVLNACSQPFFNLKTGVRNYVQYRTPSYDAGRWSISMLRSAERMMKIHRKANSVYYSLFNGVATLWSSTNVGIPVRDSISMLYASVAWVNMPLVSSRYAFYYPGRDANLNADYASNGIPTDVTVDLDVRIPYNRNMSPNMTTNTQCGLTDLNSNMPAYQFRLGGSDAVLENLATASNDQQTYADSLLNLINVVPNPYYSYSNYETASQLETKVRIVNLPTGRNSNGEQEGCYIRIYTVDGTLVRTIGPTPVNTTYIDWDLHNHTGIPIAGGMYLIHVSVPGIGERVVKWFGTMRPVDLNSFQF
ncbi:MAG: hypothetical protein IJU19_00370 [Bacteroidales bacterium]|nr:hypothetical protein [Bacteroidales bacterium]